jgi:hypothetical protein
MPAFDRESYIGVQERITQFWTEYPDGRIWTDMKSLPDEWEQVVFFAAVYKHRDDPQPAATGWDAAAKGSGGANNTAWHANCETSAIGRALANMGYAKTSDERASREEMERVVHQPPRPNAPQMRDVAPRSHETPPPVSGDPTIASPKQVAMIRGLARQKGIKPEALEARSSQLYSVPVERLSRRDASDLIKRLEAVPDVAPDPVSGGENDSHNDSDVQAMIADFDTRHPADAAKFRQ